MFSKDFIFPWHVWVGWKREREVVKWFTSDGKSKYMNFTRWASGGPNLYSSITLLDCVCLDDHSQYWIILDCAYGLKFICNIYLWHQYATYCWSFGCKFTVMLDWYQVNENIVIQVYIKQRNISKFNQTVITNLVNIKLDYIKKNNL